MTKFSGSRKIHSYSAVCLTSVLLFAGWPAAGFAPLLLIAWVPMLALEDYFFENKETVRHSRIFYLAYACFFLWNVLSTWWIYYASAFGACAAIFFNSLFMATVFAAFHKVRCRLGSKAGYVALLVCWTGFEYLHLNWDLSWPWLTLGNGFAAFPELVQWYAYTGVLGGTLWILLCNVLVYRSVKSALTGIDKVPGAYRLISYSVMVILLPVLLSLWMYFSYTENPHPVKVAVVQPNIDPYNEKFTTMSSEEQVAIMLRLGATVIDSSTDYLVGPETALPYSIWEDALPAHHDIQTLKAFLQPFPKLQIIAGVSTNKLYGAVPPTASARKFRDSPEYYDSYNTAMQIDRAGNIQLYHKSQLVIGVEKIPYPRFFGYFEKYAIALGGASGSLGTQDEPGIFDSPQHIKIAPAICYESIYGAYISKYVKKGAQLIFIITNDGWWYDTPGYRQHLQYARLRAVETRRSIARSANTGISAFINQRGDVIQKTRWWEPVAIQQTINANEVQTFYVKWGDYVGVIAAALAVILLAVSFISRFINFNDN